MGRMTRMTLDDPDDPAGGVIRMTLHDPDDPEPINRGELQLLSFCVRAREGNGSLLCGDCVGACEELLLSLALACMDAVVLA